MLIHCVLILLFLVNRLAQRIVQGDVPQALMNRKVCVLCGSLCFYFLFIYFLCWCSGERCVGLFVMVSKVC